MTTQTLLVQSSAPTVLRLVNLLPQIFSGKAPAYVKAATTLSARIGNTMLGDIKTDYIAKSKALIGQDGILWPANAPQTVIRKVKKHLGNLSGNDPQNQAFKARFEEYKRQLSAAKAVLKPILDSMGPLDKKAAFSQLKQQVAAATGYFAHEFRKEEGEQFADTLPFALTFILRDTGVMLNSLSAGQLDQPYKGPDSDQQIFIPQPGQIIIGTRVKYAATHQFGDDARHIPQRQFIPLPHQIPVAWWRDVLDATIDAIILFVKDTV